MLTLAVSVIVCEMSCQKSLHVTYSSEGDFGRTISAQGSEIEDKCEIFASFCVMFRGA